VDALAQSAATLNATTLPRLNRMSEDATRAARQLGRAAGNLSENPQSLLYGNGPVAPGPGRARLCWLPAAAR
jgi:phospholipid/cholesterol/gamma-HCH transport system substrate-binding protein